jgi:hypothetical protein
MFLAEAPITSIHVSIIYALDIAQLAASPINVSDQIHLKASTQLAPGQEQIDMGPRKNSIGPLHHAFLYSGIARAHSSGGRYGRGR